MPTNSHQPRIRIDVAFGGGLTLQARDVVQKYVASYAACVARDLRLPEVDITWTELPFAGQVDVEINGVKCRVASPTRWRDAHNHPRAVCMRVAKAIHANRELLIDDRIAEAIRGTLGNGQPYLPALSRAGFATYLRLLVRGFFRIDRGGELNRRPISAMQEWSPETCFHEATYSLSGLRCVLHLAADSEVDREALKSDLLALQDSLFWQMGQRIPQFEQRIDPELRRHSFQLQLNDLRLPPAFGLGASQVMCEPERIGFDLGKHAWRSRAHPATHAEVKVASVPRQELDAVKLSWGTSVLWDARQLIVNTVRSELSRFAEVFIVGQSVERNLDLLRDLHAELVEAALIRFGLRQITEVVRTLVDEEIGVRDLRGVLHSMLSVNSVLDLDHTKFIGFAPAVGLQCPAVFGESVDDLNAEGLAECVRINHRRYISYSYSEYQRTVTAWLLDGDLEARLERAATEPLTPAEHDSLCASVREEVRTATTKKTVVLTTASIRRRVRRLLEIEFPDLPVLSYQELAPDYNIQPVARIYA